MTSPGRVTAEWFPAALCSNLWINLNVTSCFRVPVLGQKEGARPTFLSHAKPPERYWMTPLRGENRPLPFTECCFFWNSNPLNFKGLRTWISYPNLPGHAHACRTSFGYDKRFDLAGLP